MVQEQTLEQVLTRLNEIGDQVTTVAEEVGEIKNNGNLLKQNLLGGVEGEMPHGRIPKAEAAILNHDGRIVALENAHIRYRAYGTVIGVVSGVLSGIVTGTIVLLIQYAMGKH